MGRQNRIELALLGEEYKRDEMYLQIGIRSFYTPLIINQPQEINIANYPRIYRTPIDLTRLP